MNYISKNQINVYQKPEYANFRNNKFSFCEIYTLLDITSIIIINIFYNHFIIY